VGILIAFLILFTNVQMGCKRIGKIGPGKESPPDNRNQEEGSYIRQHPSTCPPDHFCLHCHPDDPGRNGIQLAPLLATAGIGALAIGFGAQSLVKDVIMAFSSSLKTSIGSGT